jgi:hypothetical protein
MDLWQDFFFLMNSNYQAFILIKLTIRWKYLHFSITKKHLTIFLESKPNDISKKMYLICM